MFSDAEKDQIRLECFKDPVLFNRTFLDRHFFLDAPWFHRGAQAVLAQQTEFLLKYGQLSKIVRHFIHQTDEEHFRQVFHVVDRETRRELQIDEIEDMDEKIRASRLVDPGAVPDLGVDVLLDLGDFTLIEMPRGSSKTTLAGFGDPIRKILYQMIRFMLYVSKAGPHSQGQLESVRKELANNEIIREFFGDLKPARSDEERWSKEKFETNSGIAMQYRGKGAAIRGVNHNNFRPDVILIDDPQSKDDIRSEVIREEDKRWAFAELTPARSRITQSTMTALGTNVGAGCLVEVWSKDPRWTTVCLEVIDKDGDFIWPEFMNRAKYDEEKESYQRAGLLPDFYREYHNRIIDEDSLPFPRKFIQLESAIPERKDFVCATYADLATSAKRGADFSAIVTVAQDMKGKVWVLDCWMERGSTEEQKCDEYFAQSIKWQSEIHGFESNAYQAVFEQTLRAEMFRRGHYFEILPVLHKTRKIDRIRGALRPRYAAGYVYHRVSFPELEGQLFDFRYDDSHLHDDGPDAIAAALVLLDPAAAFNAGEDPTETHLEDLEEALGGDWRNAS